MRESLYVLFEQSESARDFILGLKFGSDPAEGELEFVALGAVHFAPPWHWTGMHVVFFQEFVPLLRVEVHAAEADALLGPLDLVLRRERPQEGTELVLGESEAGDRRLLFERSSAELRDHVE